MTGISWQKCPRTSMACDDVIPALYTRRVLMCEIEPGVSSLRTFGVFVEMMEGNLVRFVYTGFRIEPRCR